MLARIFASKDRPTFDPLIVHLSACVLAAPELGAALAAAGVVRVETLSPIARARVEALGRAFWPGPLTLVLPKDARVPDLATSGLDTVGVRVPRHELTQALLAATGFPLAAPSANRFGRISPTTAAAVDAELGDRIPWILDGGPCAVGVESTVIAVNAVSGALRLLRPGGTPVEAIAKAAGISAQEIDGAPAHTTGTLLAPGMLESHYAPALAFKLLSAPVAQLAAGSAPRHSPGDRIGLLVFSGEAQAAGKHFSALTGAEVQARALTHAGDLNEAAARLFAELRALDETPGLTAIYAEPCPTETGLGHAITDRLRRASATNRAKRPS